MQPQKPSLSRILFGDYASLLSALFPLIFWTFTGYYFFVGDNSAQFFMFLSAIITVIAVPFFLWRYRSISSVFEDGMESQGTITAISFFRGRGRVNYVYNFQGQEYGSGNTINRTKYTKDLRVGQQVSIFVDRENPKRAFIKQIYL